MRQLILLVLGIAIGAIGAANAVNILRQRDAYPRGLMDVMQHHLATMHGRIRAGKCETGLESHLIVMRTLATDLESAIYAGVPAPAGFHKDANRLRAALKAFPVDSAPADCKATAPALQRISQACDDCHQDYR